MGYLRKHCHDLAYTDGHDATRAASLHKKKHAMGCEPREAYYAASMYPSSLPDLYIIVCAQQTKL